MSYTEEYYCPNCGATLNNQSGFDPSNGSWTCTECYQHLMDDDVYDGDIFEGIEWRCDCCNALLNRQSFFSDSFETWTCTECGHINGITEDDIIDENDLIRCPNCDGVLNNQFGFSKYDNSGECPFCGAELHRDYIWEDFSTVEDEDPVNEDKSFEYAKDDESYTTKNTRNKSASYSYPRRSTCKSSKSNNWRWFFLCLFLGHFGVHKFAEGKIGIGILYIFTMGLFHIGWLIDVIKYFKQAIAQHYFYIKNIKKQMSCPSCKNGTMTFNKKTSLWVCEDCGYSFSEQYFLDDCVFWFCDECETYLNNQEGFDRNAAKHICRNCGYENDTTCDNIKGICSDCGKTLHDPDATLCADCKQARRERAKQWLITAGKVAAGIAVVVGAAVVAASTAEDAENTDYSYIPLPVGDDDERIMKFSHVTDSWMQSASEDELRSVEKEMRAALYNIDYDSDEHSRIYEIHIDVVNTIASRFPLNLPHREHGWYLPNDDD